MIRIVIDIEEHGDALATKEAVAMALEHLGGVRVARVIRLDGKISTATGGGVDGGIARPSMFAPNRTW